MTGGFGGFINEKKDREVKLYVRNREVDKLIKEYKKLKKYQKSSIRSGLEKTIQWYNGIYSS